MKATPKTLTFGKFIMAMYDSSGKRAKGIVRLAVNAHLIEFKGPRRFEISEPDRPMNSRYDSNRISFPLNRNA